MSYNFRMAIAPVVAFVVTNGMSMDAPLESAKIVKRGLCNPRHRLGMLVQIYRRLSSEGVSTILRRACLLGVSKMLRTVESVYGCTVAARDGDIGSVDQVYFDDEAWGVRYLVVDTGNWFNKRRVLISPYSFKQANPASGIIEVDLTQQQVKDSPNIDTDKPVSRQHEAEYLGYYGYPTYWAGAYLWGVGAAYPPFGPIESTRGTVSEVRDRRDMEADNRPADVHLRSSKAVRGYHIEAADGRIGHVSGFIFDDEAWVIRYLCIDTSNWWPGGKEVLLATQWIELVDWVGSTVSTRLTRDAIKNSPEYDESVPLSRRYEAKLHKHYGKGGYW